MHSADPLSMGLPVHFFVASRVFDVIVFFQYQVNTADRELKKPAIIVNINPLTGNGYLPAAWLPPLMMENHAAILVTFTLNATEKYLLAY
jgi:hypothetical protein